MPVNSKYCTYDPVQKIWSGPKITPIYNTDANLGFLILQRLIQSPQNVFQISDDSGIELTNLDIYKRSIKFAKFLTKAGLKQGDVLGLNASNCEHIVPIMFACFILGIAVHPLALVMDVKEICYMWSKTRPKIIFCDGKIVEKVKVAVEEMELDAKIYTVIEKVEGFLSADDVLKAEDDNVEDFE
jgi:acyl-CoA synthetase (AMP-forming)/AMP-acid ligase II